MLEIFKPAIGLHAWGMWWDNQAGTNIEFGKPSMIVHKETTARRGRLAGKQSRWVQIKGECGLMLWVTHWTLMEYGEIAATIDSPYEHDFNSISAALHRLQGKKLEDIEIDAVNALTTFVFDLGGKLICKRFDEDWDAEESMWSLQTPEGIHTCHADGSIKTTAK